MTSLSDHFSSLLDDALYMGMQEDEYWAYTPAQYYKRFKIYQKRRDADLRD